MMRRWRMDARAEATALRSDMLHSNMQREVEHEQDLWDAAVCIQRHARGQLVRNGAGAVAHFNDKLEKKYFNLACLDKLCATQHHSALSNDVDVRGALILDYYLSR